ncbi:hypothetical protein HK096_009734 [Nowakowskiella sp. JEL0078]|nr:hypothetical protein HK096_009734 [Nowakowskiella sp. JEL0078]
MDTDSGSTKYSEEFDYSHSRTVSPDSNKRSSPSRGSASFNSSFSWTSARPASSNTTDYLQRSSRYSGISDTTFTNGFESPELCDDFQSDSTSGDELENNEPMAQPKKSILENSKALASEIQYPPIETNNLIIFLTFIYLLTSFRLSYCVDFLSSPIDFILSLSKSTFFAVQATRKYSENSIETVIKPQPTNHAIEYQRSWGDFLAANFINSTVQTAVYLKKSGLPDQLSNLADTTLESYNRLDKVFDLQTSISTVVNRGLKVGGVVANALIKASIAYQRTKGPINSDEEVKVVRLGGGVPGMLVPPETRDVGVQTDNGNVGVVKRATGMGFRVVGKATELLLGRDSAEVLLYGERVGKVVFRVGDELFNTEWKILMKAGSESLFEKLREGKQVDNIVKRNDGSYFINRDSDLFRLVLLYLQRDTSALDLDPITLQQLHTESIFYNISSLTEEIEAKAASTLGYNPNRFHYTESKFLDSTSNFNIINLDDLFNIRFWVPPVIFTFCFGIWILIWRSIKWIGKAKVLEGELDVTKKSLLTAGLIAISVLGLGIFVVLKVILWLHNI